MNKKVAWYLLNTVNSILLEMNFKPFLIGGTLLGAMREKDFIEHDNDVDLAITDDLFLNQDKFLKFLKELEKQNLRCGSLWDFHELSILSKNTKDFHLDLVYCRKEKDYYKFTYNSGYHKYPEIYFNTLTRINFQNILVYVPNDAEKLLKLKFGEDWKKSVNNKKAGYPIDTKKKPISVYKFPLLIANFEE